MLKVLNGTDYFYEWGGEQRALLQFVRLQDIGWYLEQIESVDGEDISEMSSEGYYRDLFGFPRNVCLSADRV